MKWWMKEKKGWKDRMVVSKGGRELINKYWENMQNSSCIDIVELIGCECGK